MAPLTVESVKSMKVQVSCLFAVRMSSLTVTDIPSPTISTGHHSNRRSICERINFANAMQSSDMVSQVTSVVDSAGFAPPSARCTKPICQPIFEGMELLVCTGRPSACELQLHPCRSSEMS